MHLSLSRHKPEDTELLTARNMSHRNGAVLTSPGAHISSSLRKNIWTKISLTYKGWWSTLSQRLINSLWTISSKHQSIVYWPPVQENWLIGELSAQNIDYAEWTLISMPTDTGYCCNTWHSSEINFKLKFRENVSVHDNHFNFWIVLNVCKE